MQWFWIALLAPALWAVVNHVDKLIVSKYFSGRGLGSLVIFTSLSSGIISLFILVFRFSELSMPLWPALAIMANGALLVASYIPYLRALEHEEASTTSIMYQTIPVFGYFLGMIFLREYLSPWQIVGSLLIISGAVIVSLDFQSGVRFKLWPLLWMALASLMVAINGLVFKVIALDQNFWSAAFWEYAGGFAFGLFLLALVPLYRRQFTSMIKNNWRIFATLNLFAETINIIAKLLTNFASLLAPLALVWAVNGFQPLFVVIYGIILTVFAPQWGKENIEKRTILQKVLAIILIFFGAWLLFK